MNPNILAEVLALSPEVIEVGTALAKLGHDIASKSDPNEINTDILSALNDIPQIKAAMPEITALDSLVVTALTLAGKFHQAQPAVSPVTAPAPSTPDPSIV